MFFQAIAKFILRNRLLLLLAIIAATAFFGWKAMQVKLSYEFAKILPATDSTLIAYENFKGNWRRWFSTRYRHEGRNLFFTPGKFNAWFKPSEDIKKIEGVEAAVSVAKLINIVRNDSTHQFDIVQLTKGPIGNQQEADSIKAIIESLPFYNGFIFNKVVSCDGH